ncbi:hypothetical protein F2Q68_00003833 [Brassica cretica]|uniref:rRNA biogenesis protein RRP36 n=1 Tax=Brassica cretica TaxID=69181 RepID=A0A8S9JL13_BRACR|nr:hypothetical protein F2Q68_00003833 [Brassica cretica]
MGISLTISNNVSEIRKQELIEKYNSLKESGKLSSFLDKRRKKNATKDHKGFVALFGMRIEIEMYLFLVCLIESHIKFTVSQNLKLESLPPPPPLSRTHRLLVSISPPSCLPVSFFMASTGQSSNLRRSGPAELNHLCIP